MQGIGTDNTYVCVDPLTYLHFYYNDIRIKLMHNIKQQWFKIDF